MKYKLALQMLIVITSTALSSLTFAQATTINTFYKAHVGFGNGLKQEALGRFSFPNNTSNIRKINMIVKLQCPSDHCGAWDVFASISVKNSATNTWYEMGRYITPYGVDNHARGRGFVFDVTDFKSLLKGRVNLRSFTEVWTTSGWLVTVKFDLFRGTPDYPYTAIAPAIHHANHSLDLPYGKPLRRGQTLKSKITVPINSEETKLRTTISGWGHANPGNCAEWCVRTHTIAIDYINTIFYRLNPIGCASNPINNQRGNWRPNRAGWCPGMEVPVRNTTMNSTYAGQTFMYEHKFQPYRTVDAAYYAVTSFVVVKSNTPIRPPKVTPIFTKTHAEN